VSAAAERRQAARSGRPTLPSAVGFVLAIAIVWLGGQFVTQGLSDRYLDDDPEVAVLLRGDSSDAVAALARKRLIAHDNDGAARLATRALQLYPLNAPALTTYGFAMGQLGKPADAEAAMSVAGERGWRDVLTQVWLFRRDLLARNYDGAVAHGDAVMRRQDITPTIVLAVLAAAARDPAAIAPLVQRLSASPPWRRPLFDYLTLTAKPPATDLAGVLIARLAKGPAPPTDDEIALYLRRLVADQRFDEAAADWRWLEPHRASAGYVVDGGFETSPGETPFDWQLPQGVGWTSAILDAPPGRGGQALQISYDGVSPPGRVQQMMILPPGRYRIAGRAYVESGSAPQMLEWRLVCMTTGEVLARSPTAAAKAAWTPFGADVMLPQAGCPAEWLVLTAEAGDIRDDLVVWYDDLAVQPAGVAESSDAKTR
jgi:hypothetical protein